MSPTEDRASGELREGCAEIGDQRLRYVEAGEGPLIVLLHGFPEFWYGWRQQIQPLAAARSRVVAPDLRGYKLSSKPDGAAAYDIGQLAARPGICGVRLPGREATVKGRLSPGLKDPE